MDSQSSLPQWLVIESRTYPTNSSSTSINLNDFSMAFFDVFGDRTSRLHLRHCTQPNLDVSISYPSPEILAKFGFTRKELPINDPTNS